MTSKHCRYRPHDLNVTDLDLLRKACTLPDKHFITFGNSWLKLYDLNLIDAENQPTKLGRDLIQDLARVQ